jgi:hypothetical protein
MVEHLTHVEDTLRLERPAGEDVDLEAVFSRRCSASLPPIHPRVTCSWPSHLAYAPAPNQCGGR